MYRIVQAVNGYYYVQRYCGFKWSRVSPFYHTRWQARRYIDIQRGTPRGRVVEYY